MKMIVRPRAEADMVAAWDWYEGQCRGLGTRFILSVSSTLDAIGSNPRLFPAIDGVLRRAVLRRFPYGVYFVERDDTVVVVAVFHLARSPEAIERRSEEEF